MALSHCVTSVKTEVTFLLTFGVVNCKTSFVLAFIFFFL